MKKNLSGLILLTTLFLVSCEEMVSNVDVPESKSHLVLNTYLSPEDSLVTISLNRSIPMFGSETNDSVYLLGTMKINEMVVPRKTGTHDFVISQSIFSIVAGQTYTITYFAPDGTVLKGECTIPAETNTSLAFGGYDSVTMNNWVEYYMRYEFNDLQPNGNFYRVAIRQDHYMPGYPDTSYTYTSETEDFYSDISNNGDKKSGRFSLGDQENGSDVIARYLILYTCDAPYFYYHQAVIRQKDSENGPFSEPVVIPSNIENGLGCVGAYRKYTVKVN